MTVQGSAIRRSMTPASCWFAAFAVLTAMPMLSAQATFRGSNDSQATATEALVEAARSRDLPDIVSLIDAGANVNGTGFGNDTPLIAAAREGHTSVVELLLDRGANINYVAEGEGTALILASAAGRLDTVKLLVARSADLNAARETQLSVGANRSSTTASGSVAWFRYAQSKSGFVRRSPWHREAVTTTLPRFWCLSAHKSKASLRPFTLTLRLTGSWTVSEVG